MSSTINWMLMIMLIKLAVKPSDAACGSVSQRLRLRSTFNDLVTDEPESDTDSESESELEFEKVPPQLDLSQLSDKQLQQLMQQLNIADEFDEDHRGSSRPWKKVQRIIRRQLVRIPKRYLKKLLRQFGLARSNSATLRSGSQLNIRPKPQPQLYYLIPLE